MADLVSFMSNQQLISIAIGFFVWNLAKELLKQKYGIVAESKIEIIKGIGEIFGQEMTRLLTTYTNYIDVKDGKVKAAIPEAINHYKSLTKTIADFEAKVLALFEDLDSRLVLLEPTIEVVDSAIQPT